MVKIPKPEYAVTLILPDGRTRYYWLERVTPAVSVPVSESFQWQYDQKGRRSPSFEVVQLRYSGERDGFGFPVYR